MAATTTSDPAARSESSNVVPAEKESHSASILWQCTSQSPKFLVRLLQCLQLTPSNATKAATITSLWYATETGITIHSHPSPICQASLELPKQMFSRYSCGIPSNGTTTTNNSVEICVRWKTLMDCLGVLLLGSGGASNSNSSLETSSLSLAYCAAADAATAAEADYDQEEVLRLECHSTMTQRSTSSVATAAIPGLYMPLSADGVSTSGALTTAFTQHPVVARWLCNSSASLRLDVAEIEAVIMGGASSTSSITVHLQPKEQCLLLQVHGDQGNVCQVIVTGAAVEGVENASADTIGTGTGVGRKSSNITATRPWKYPYRAWQQALLPLSLAAETCFSVNSQGLLAIQHQIPISSFESGPSLDQTDVAEEDVPQPSAFCDCLLVPLEVEEEQKEDEHGNEEDAYDEQEENQSLAASYSVASSAAFNSASQDTESSSQFTVNTLRKRPASQTIQQPSTIVPRKNTSRQREWSRNNNHDDDDQDEYEFRAEEDEQRSQYRAHDAALESPVEEEGDSPPDVLPPRQPLTFGSSSVAAPAAGTPRRDSQQYRKEQQAKRRRRAAAVLTGRRNSTSSRTDDGTTACPMEDQQHDDNQSTSTTATGAAARSLLVLQQQERQTRSVHQDDNNVGSQNDEAGGGGGGDLHSYFHDDMQAAEEEEEVFHDHEQGYPSSPELVYGEQ